MPAFRRCVRSFALVLVVQVAGVSALPAGPAASPNPGESELRRSLEQGHRLILDGLYPEADALARKLLAETEDRYDPDSLEVAQVLHLWLRAHYEGSTGSLEEAQSLAQRALRIREERLGPEDSRLAESLHDLGNVLAESGAREEARAKYLRALELQRKALGAEHPAVANTLDDLGVLLMGEGELETAETLVRRALEVRERAFGPDHSEVAESLMSLACLEYYRRRYDEAKTVFERALAMRERHLGKNHPKVAGSTHNLALVSHALGDLRSARTFYERTLEIRSMASQPDRFRLAKTHSAVASLCYTLGDYSGAIAHVQEALRLHEAQLGPRHPEYAATLTQFAHLLKSTGDLPRAGEVLERALEIRRDALAPDDPEVASSLGELGWYHLSRNAPDAATPYFEAAREILEKATEPPSSSVADTLLGLALSLGERQPAKTEQLLERALSIYEGVFGPQGEGMVRPLNDLAEFRYEKGDLVGAREALGKALAIAERVGGDDHPLIARLLHGEVRVLAGLGSSGQALEAAFRAARISRDHLRMTARALPEREALTYARTSDESLDAVFTALDLAEKPSSGAMRAAWDSLLRARGLVLDESASRSRFLLATTDPGVVEFARALQSTRQSLANLAVRGPEGLSADLNADLVAELRRSESEQERVLAARSAQFRRESARAALGLKEVLENLPAGAALVAYARFNRYDPSRPSEHSVRTYVACVARADEPNPVCLTLGPALAIDAAVRTWRNEAAEGFLRRPGSPSEALAAYRKAGAGLRQRIWDPLAPHLAGVQRVFIVPDGSLNVVNVAALPIEDDRYLIEAGPSIHCLTTETDLVPLPDDEGPDGSGLLAIGGADFDARSLFAALRRLEHEPERESASTVASLAAVTSVEPEAAVESYRGPRPACSELRSMVFEPLPGSRREAEEVGGLWAGSETILTGAEASETAFKRLAPGRRVLHLATHGFVLGEPCDTGGDRRRGIGGLAWSDGESWQEVEDAGPLLLSGLALAGANHRGAATREEDDGILTAEEVAMLDLSGVEWVVLSACDTGLGPIQVGEGVFGLRRAFRIAGARTLIMSLWAVDDESARDWMRALYHARLVRGMDAVESVRHASLTVLGHRRSEGLSTHPLFWAPFVATGAWR